MESRIGKKSRPYKRELRSCGIGKKFFGTNVLGLSGCKKGIRIQDFSMLPPCKEEIETGCKESKGRIGSGWKDRRKWRI